MRFESVQVQQPEPVGQGAKLVIGRDDIDSVAVPDLVKLQPMGEIAQAMRPSIRSRSLVPSSPSLNLFSASEQKVTGGSMTGGSSR